MQIVPASEVDFAAYAEEAAHLFWLTGPASYGYQAGSRDVLDPLVKESWLSTGSLFSHDSAHLVIEDDKLLAMEVGFDEAPGFYERVEALEAHWHPILERGDVKIEQLDGVADRMAQCAWLNPVVPADVYYLHAIAVVPERRGSGLGAALLRAAIQRASAANLAEVQLDVLSDNPAVDLYRSFGFECHVESTAPIPLASGVPTEYRMGLSLKS